jgi:hypothetical protein
MKTINFNLSGTPTETYITDDVPRRWDLRIDPLASSRGIIDMPQDPTGGGHLYYAGKQINFLFPTGTGAFEASSPDPDRGWEGKLPPVLQYLPMASRIRISNGDFIDQTGKRWLVKGATMFNAMAHLRDGQDIRPLLEQVRDCGGNMVRSLTMGFPRGPVRSPVPDSVIEDYLGICLDQGLQCIVSILAGTRDLMPDPHQQLDYYLSRVQICERYPNAWSSVGNELDHSSQLIPDPRIFPQPTSGILCSRGSYQTDRHPPEPYMRFAEYGAHRETEFGGMRSSRAASQMSPAAWEHVPWPRPCPCIPVENAKPESYLMDTRYSQLMGRHGGANWGGYYHPDQGVLSVPWPPNVQQCGIAFYDSY